MDEVKELLRSALGETYSSGGDIEATLRRAKGRERKRRVFTAMFALVLFGGAGTMLWYAFRPATESPSHQPLPSASPNRAAPQPVRGVVGQPQQLGRAASVNSIAYGEGSVWVSVAADHGSGGTIVRIDPDTEDILARIPVPVVPGWEIGGGGLTVADGQVWVAGGTYADGDDGGAVVAIDPATDQIAQQFDLPAPVADVAVVDSDVWVLVDQQGPVVGVIDPNSGTLVPVYAHLPGQYGRRLIPFDGYLFAAVATGSPSINGTTILKIAPTQRTLLGALELDSYAPIATDGHALWAAPGSVVQVETGGDSRDIRGVTLDEVGATGDAAAAGEGHVWFFGAAANRAVGGYNTVTQTVDVIADVGGIALAVSPGAVWVLDGASVTRVQLP